ncbi:YcnI family protein [Nocardioides coralli]|uniref:YcnI family copper-binding membrane protein n=1 Tax=Nocardioides coralli TaxID=2872154 RepID=UPI001CA46D33|nr:YcnI family protein [Nocardioides coralli]QZY28547.1 YcnI family protein [Nocardioides coralli]
MSARTTARLGAAATTLAAVTLAASPAAAHVSATPSVANAGAYTVLTMGVPHGCDGSPTTKLEIQIPEQILSVTPTRSPFYDVEIGMEQLDEPVTDAHGNEVTERVGTVTYTATTPLPDAQRDTLELSFQVPDVPGEMLAFPTVQTCAKGSTGWVEIPEEGQDAHELEAPAPMFEVLPAADEGHGAGASDASEEEPAEHGETTEAAATTDGSGIAWAGLVLGALGLAAGGTALLRSRRSA